MAERVGFEPTVELLTPHTLSKRAPYSHSDISPRLKKSDGGGGGTRTHEGGYPLPAFEAGAIATRRLLLTIFCVSTP